MQRVLRRIRIPICPVSRRPEIPRIPGRPTPPGGSDGRQCGRGGQLISAHRNFCLIGEIKLTANPCIALCSSTNAVSFSSARTMKRFPSRCASTIQIVRPSTSRAETQPKLQPALLRLSAMISQYSIRNDLRLPERANRCQSKNLSRSRTLC